MCQVTKRDHSEEFVCVECGRHIVRIIAMPEIGPLCGMCIHFPGWFRYPDVRALVDPDVRPPEHEDYKCGTDPIQKGSTSS